MMYSSRKALLVWPELFELASEQRALDASVAAVEQQKVRDVVLLNL